MKIHSKARTTVFQRARIVEKVHDRSWTIRAAAEASGVSRRTIYKWLSRAKREPGPLSDRSSRPHLSPLGLPDDARDLILSMRRYRMTGERIAQSLRIPRATVARILKAAGVGKLKDLEPKEPVIRYERSVAGELIHIDIKKLGRINGVGHRITGDRRHRGHGGWEYVFVAVDDASRLAFAETYRDEKAASAITFLQKAVAFFRRHGVTVRGVLTDNGKVFVCRDFQLWCQRLGIKRQRTRPYRPQTNGKAERFIQTLVRQWAHGRPFTSSAQRRRALDPWLRYYNFRRPHGGLKGATPISRLAQTVNNVVRNHIYPTLLDDLPAPRLRVYPRATVVAEKLEAIVSLGMANSRMKDYFDLRALAGEGNVDAALLADAIAATFRRRNTPIPPDLAVGLSDEFAQNAAKRAQWKAFLNKSRLTAPTLDKVVAEIREFTREPLRLAAQRTVGL